MSKFNPLSANRQNGQHKLSVFGHFVGLALKGLTRRPIVRVICLSDPMCFKG